MMVRGWVSLAIAKVGVDLFDLEPPNFATISTSIVGNLPISQVTLTALSNRHV